MPYSAMHTDTRERRPMAKFAKLKWIASPALVAAGIFFLALSAISQTTPEKPAPSHEDGIPVTDQLVVSKCSGCHQADAKGNLSRISNIRTTPEGWEEAIKRMIRLNGLVLSPDEARQILRYLSNSHGLAPEEAAPVAYYAERRLVDEKFTDPDIRHACGSCHAIARPLSWRRSPDDWKKLVNTHIALFPSIEFTSFQRPPHARESEASEPAADSRAPVDKALEYIEKSTPLHTAAWSAWQPSIGASPKLAGRWLVTGESAGKGKFYGDMVLSPGPSPDQFVTKTTLHFADGSEQEFCEDGTSIVYTGFQWRGRSNVQQPDMVPGKPKTVREVMMVSPDQSRMEGRWFWGVYQEFGMDVTLRRAQEGPTVLGANLSALRTGSTGNKVTIFGDHLPSTITAAGVDLGAGVKVTDVVAKTPGAITVTADVAADATPGMRSISVGEATEPAALAVYHQVDFLKVLPVTPIAHLGSEPHAKGYAQFEAVGYSFGPDGKPNTADDINLGVMPATWKLEEFVASYADDDLQFVGSIDPKTGLFTPSSDGPSPQRKSMRNNYGDVWVVASVTPPGESTTLSAKSYLVVSVPQYMQYDQPEVGQ
jgi:quinohemoprotein amine dehydrogenase